METAASAVARSRDKILNIIRSDFEAMITGNGACAAGMERHTSGAKQGQYISDITEHLWIGYSSRALSHPVGAVEGIPNTVPDDDPEWVIVQRPGFVPMRKGPFMDGNHVKEMLEAMYSQYPDCMCLVISMPQSSYPESGREWLDIFNSQ